MAFNSKGEVANAKIDKRKNARINRQMMQKAIGQLQDCDIVVRKGNDVISDMFCDMNLKDKSYSHCGIVQIENGRPYIYHSIGGEDNPDETLRRDSASFWCSPRQNMSFAILRYDLSDTQKQNLKKQVLVYYAQKKKFDMQFDLSSDDKLYCTEFVYKCLNSVLPDSQAIKPNEKFGRVYVATENITHSTASKWVCKVIYK
ncbi:MAG: hypothetical protein JST82_12005 [Bacteroidetes bacterium]|nr:hypothetical protein [Bacteroidota bacterium]